MLLHFSEAVSSLTQWQGDTAASQALTGRFMLAAE